MATWRYLFHTLRGDAYLAELPLEAVTFDLVLGGFGVGSFAAEVPLFDPRVRALNWRAATEPGEVVCYSECDGELVGGHVIWDTVYHESNQRLSLAGNELWSYYMHRVLPLERNFAAVDQFDIARTLVGDVVAEVGDAGLLVDAVGSGASGITRDRQYPYGKATLLGDAIDRLAKVINGFDYRIAITRDDTGIHRRFVLGYPRLGRTVDEDHLTFAFPGAIATFDWPRQGSVRITRAIATGSGLERVEALDRGKITAGAVLLDGVNSYPAVSDGATLLSLAMGRLAAHEAPALSPALTLRRTALPPLSTLELGDDVLVAIEEPAYFPAAWDSPDGIDHRVSLPFRLVGLRVTPVGDKVELTLAGDVQPTSDDVVDGTGAPVPTGTVPTSSLPGSGSSTANQGALALQQAAAAAGSGGGGGQQIVTMHDFSMPGHAAQDVDSLAFTVPAGCAPCVTAIAFGSISGGGADAALELSLGGTTWTINTTAGTDKLPFCIIAPVNDLASGDYTALLHVTSTTDWHSEGQLQLWST